MGPFQARAPRREVDFPVELTLDHPPGRSIGSSLNVSATGMLVLAKEPTPAGSIVSFESVQASGTAEVIWTRTKEEDVLLGLTFVSLRRADKTVISAETEGDELDPDRVAWSQAWSSGTGTGVSFRTATDRLLEHGFTLAEIGLTIGSPIEAIRHARLAPEAAEYSRPPHSWKERLAELARGRGADLDALAAELAGW